LNPNLSTDLSLDLDFKHQLGLIINWLQLGLTLLFNYLLNSFIGVTFTLKLNIKLKLIINMERANSESQN
jgi:hypothetical protein